MPNLKAIEFDFMGTCCDWHSSILPALQASPSTTLLPPSSLPDSTTGWRAGLVKGIHSRFEAGLPAEDIDVTHRLVLDRLLEEKGIDQTVWGEDVRKNWWRGGMCRLLSIEFTDRVDHIDQSKGWPDALPGLMKLRENYFVYVWIEAIH